MLDTLSRLLEGVRPRGALFARSYMRAPWALRFDEGAPLTVAAMLRGEGWLAAGHDDDGIALGAGDVAIIVGPASYTVAERPGVRPRVVVHADNLCTTPVGGSLDETTELCSHTPAPDDDAVLLTATFAAHGSLRGRLLEALPRVLTVSADELPHPTLDVIAAELRAERPGQQAVLDRLLELLLVTALRAWLERGAGAAPGWHQAQDDPIVGAVLQRLHEDPAHPWTVEELARSAAVSRATFARRFTELMGEPPMAYLTCWRMCLAADLLRETSDTVGAIATQVGYANAYALSVAFMRTHGARPTEYRARTLAESRPPLAAVG